jgi:AmiR/NasT family two-component response regulator
MKIPKILVADDDWVTKVEIAEMLTDLGYEVAGQAETAMEAIVMARDLKPDLVLMDVEMSRKMNGMEMPGEINGVGILGEINGVDAARVIKTESGTPIIFMSGYGDPEYIEAAKEITPFGYMMKPFDDTEIHAFVEIALSKRKLELELEEAHKRLEQTNLDLQKEIEER